MSGALALLAAQASFPATSREKEKFRNAQVIVTEESLAPSEKGGLPESHPCLFVFLGGRTARVVTASGKTRSEHVERGQVWFEPAAGGSIWNDDASELRFVRVEFLNHGSDDTWGMTGLAPAYRMLLENGYARTYEIRIPAQGFEPQHTHHDRVVVCLSGAELEHILPNGEHQPARLKTGEVTWRPAATHTGHNTGHTDLWVVAIEPK